MLGELHEIWLSIIVDTMWKHCLSFPRILSGGFYRSMWYNGPEKFSEFYSRYNCYYQYYDYYSYIHRCVVNLLFHVRFYYSKSMLSLNYYYYDYDLWVVWWNYFDLDDGYWNYYRFVVLVLTYIKKHNVYYVGEYYNIFYYYYIESYSD